MKPAHSCHLSQRHRLYPAVCPVDRRGPGRGLAAPLADLSKDDMAAYGTVIFGGRFHAGSVDGLKQAKALAAACQVPRFLVFATGPPPLPPRTKLPQPGPPTSPQRRPPASPTSTSPVACGTRPCPWGIS